MNVTSKSVLDIYDVNRLIILDPQANETLSPECVSDDDVIVVGGILGADPPLGRTKRMITDRVPGARSYNIGSRQLTIDGSVFVASKVAGGSEIDEIDFVDDIEIRTDWSTMITLPYRYPIRDGKPIISNEIVDLVKRYGLPDPNDRETIKIWGELDE
jgi:ribosome biogenesis SPOUT family RNA methylase Rps3